MPNDDILTDDYVAGLLAQEAKDCSLKYSAMGMEAFRPNKKPANMPKPNTRFLRHIIKDTNTHNKNLLAKEAAESRARLDDLEQAEELKRLKNNPNSKDIRKRQLGDIQALLGGKKRRRTSEDDETRESRRSEKRHTSEHQRHKSSRRDKDLVGDRSDDRKRRGRLERDDEGSSGAEPTGSSSKATSRRQRTTGEGSSIRKHDRTHRDGRRRNSSSVSPEPRHKSGSHRQSGSKHHHRSRNDDVSGSSAPTQDMRNQDLIRSTQKSQTKTPAAVDDDRDISEESDSLDELIGPKPLPKYRGRGAVAETAGIDRRFSESYDPKKDVSAGDDDWDDAVESFREAQKLKQQQAKRTAEFKINVDSTTGTAFNGDEIPEDVKWSKAGERREWDRGKGLDGEDL